MRLRELALRGALRGTLRVTWWGALWGALLFLACAPPAPAGPARSTLCPDAASCERAIVAAPKERLAALLRAYTAVRGDGGWVELYTWLRREPDKPARLGEERALPPAPEAVALDDMLLALARHAGRRHVVVLEGAAARHLFARDPLAPHMLGLAPIIAAEPAAIDAEVAQAALLEEAFAAAARFDYVAAAAAAEKLRASVGRTEAALRARFGLWLLDAAGIGLGTSAGAAESPAPPARLSSPYAELLAVQLARPDHHAAWDARKRRILAGMSAERVKVLERMYGKDEGCDGALAPPIEHPSDVAFASQLALSLDPEAAPAGPAKPGKLPPLEWHARYGKLVDLAADSGSAWAVISALLRQRGELVGLSGEGSAAYDQVTELGLRHIEALAELAEAEPERVQPLALASLIYQPGALADRRLGPALARFVERLTAVEMGRARDAAAVLDASLAGLAAAMSYPPELQGTQLGAVARALSGKLGGDLGDEGGWGVAGLWAGRGALGALLGEEGALADAAAGIARALAAGAAEPALARVAASAARYLGLGLAGKLDATVSNVALFPPERSKARAALADAIAALAEAGPTSPPERDLAAALTDLGDGLVAAVAARATAPAGAPACGGAAAVPAPLAEALRRLHKKRKALLSLPAFGGDDDGAWVRRARLFAVILSDVLDVAERQGGVLRWSVEDERARAIVDRALAGWLAGPGADLAAGGYLLARSVLGQQREEGADAAVVSAHAVRALAALGELFGEERSLWRALAELGSESGEGGEGDSDVGDLLTRYAGRAFARGRRDHGDLLLLLHLGAAVARDQAVAPAAVALARDRARPVYLPLLLYSKRADAKDSARVMERASRSGCPRADPSAVIAVERAIDEFLSGQRAEALARLEELLARAPADGFVVPRQLFHFEARQGDKLLTAEHSISFGSRLLRGAGTFQLGLGLSSGAAAESQLTVRMADPTLPEAQAEAARYFAHAAALTAVYAFVAGEPQRAARAARRALGAWLHGVRLGKARVASRDRWSADAIATLVLAGQLAADAELPLLAGELWTLAKGDLDPAADDGAVAALLTPLPLYYEGIAELEPVAERARESLVLLAEALPCTRRRGLPEAHLRPRCGGYATALALRTADALPSLPRLKRSPADASACVAWRDLDAFVAAADQGIYEPDLLVKAVESLHFAARDDDAATVLARHRHRHHCNPALTKIARELGGRDELGVHLRADLLSVAANCSAAGDAAPDLARLDELTQAHALPHRNLEVILFACRLAVEHGRWPALYELSARPRFLERHGELGADVGTAALLIHHAAAVGAGKPLDLAATLPFYRLLCTTFPPKDQRHSCQAIGVLRGDAPKADKQRAAKAALAKLLAEAIDEAPSP